MWKRWLEKASSKPWGWSSPWLYSRKPCWPWPSLTLLKLNLPVLVMTAVFDSPESDSPSDITCVALPSRCQGAASLLLSGHHLSVPMGNSLTCGSQQRPSARFPAQWCIFLPFCEHLSTNSFHPQSFHLCILLQLRCTPSVFTQLCLYMYHSGFSFSGSSLMYYWSLFPKHS